MPAVTAHIIVTSATALLLLVVWGAAGLGVLAGFVLLIMELHHRRLGALILVASALAAWVVAAITPWPPMRPLYSMSVAQPRSGGQVTSPVAIMVCGRLPDGTPADIPGADRVVSLSLDGRQVEVAHSPLLALAVATGDHRLRVEILTGDHREFVPPMVVEVAIKVAGPGLPALAAYCPG